jgi:hypothetical protein
MLVQPGRLRGDAGQNLFEPTEGCSASQAFEISELIVPGFRRRGAPVQARVAVARGRGGRVRGPARGGASPAYRLLVIVLVSAVPGYCLSRLSASCGALPSEGTCSGPACTCRGRTTSATGRSGTRTRGTRPHVPVGHAGDRAGPRFQMEITKVPQPSPSVRRRRRVLLGTMAWCDARAPHHAKLVSGLLTPVAT